MFTLTPKNPRNPRLGSAKNAPLRRHDVFSASSRLCFLLGGLGQIGQQLSEGPADHEAQPAAAGEGPWDGSFRQFSQFSVKKTTSRNLVGTLDFRVENSWRRMWKKRRFTTSDRTWPGRPGSGSSTVSTWWHYHEGIRGLPQKPWFREFTRIWHHRMGCLRWTGH